MSDYRNEAGMPTGFVTLLQSAPFDSRPIKRAPAGGSRGFDGTTIRNEIVAPYLVGGLSEAGKIVRLGVQFIRQYAEELRNIRRIIGDVPRLYRGHAQERDGLLHGLI